MSSRGTPTPSKIRPSQGSPFRLGGENEGGRFFWWWGELDDDPTVGVTSWRNVYRGKELVGSIVYDAAPKRREIDVSSVYIKPKYRRDVRPFLLLVRPLVMDGRPINPMCSGTVDDNVEHVRLERLAIRAADLGRVKLGHHWAAMQQLLESLEASARTGRAGPDRWRTFNPAAPRPAKSRRSVTLESSSGPGMRRF